MSRGLPREFVNEWYEKADGITFFDAPIRRMDAAELMAVAAFLSERIATMEGRPRPPIGRSVPFPAKPAPVPHEGFTYTVIGGNL